MMIMPIIIMALCDGEEREFMDNLYKTHNKLMFATVWKYIKTPADVEDVVSDGCIALMRNLTTLRNLEQGALQVYIVKTMRNMALNLINKQRINNQYCTVFGDEDISADIEYIDGVRKIVLDEELDAVINAIERLPRKEKLVMKMMYLHEMDYKIIAELLELSIDSIHKYVSRARAKIKKAIYAKGEGV